MKTALALALLLGASAAWAQPAGALQDPQTVGTARLKVWGFEVYDARLLAEPGFAAADYEKSAFALELNYLRAFKGGDIAERSIGEMRDIAPLGDEQATRWQKDMAALFPDVKRGDRITGVHLPGQAARFFLNERLLGEVRDAEFARRFFGIWLSSKTSQPAMRAKLIGRP
jgi:hypothetical protein